MLICIKCWKNNCKCKEPKIEIDDSITKSICLLNKKGYTTNYCCGGHITKSEILSGYIPNIYISFNKYFDKEIPVKLLNDSWTYSFTDRVLRCFIKEAKQYKIYNGKNKNALSIYNKEFNKESENELEIILDKERHRLYEWVKILP